MDVEQQVTGDRMESGHRKLDYRTSRSVLGGGGAAEDLFVGGWHWDSGLRSPASAIRWYTD